jgi:hypothetical protein
MGSRGDGRGSSIVSLFQVEGVLHGGGEQAAAALG